MDSPLVERMIAVGCLVSYNKHTVRNTKSTSHFLILIHGQLKHFNYYVKKKMNLRI